ncbi:MAG: L-ribulose-5-phosphate 4-epimerase AraD [Spirochaetota bacterium]
MAYEKLKEEVYQANMGIQKNRLAPLTWGNVSQMDRDAGVFAIKPSGVPYESLSAENMVVIELESGKGVEPQALRPSSDTATHLELYRAFRDLGGICHTHSPFACSWAQARRDIPILGTTHADYTAGDIPCTEVMSDAAIQGDYEVETGRQIIARLEGLKVSEIEMILVACHGPFTWGKDGRKALENAVVLEEIAKIAFHTVSLNPDIAPLKETLRAKHYLRKHGKNAYYGQN